MNSDPQPSPPNPPAGPAPAGDPDEAAVDVQAVARGERAAIEVFYRELLEPVYAFVYWRVGGDRQEAEDVTQETFVQALASLHRFEARSGLYTWVCGIARNLARERGRSRARDARTAGDGDEPGLRPSASAGPEAQLARAETERLVGLALTELPPRYQQALVDKYVHQRSFAEMAAAARSTPKAVESAVQRAKRALAEGLRRLGLGGTDGGAHE
jgi:RNA polymerase sigma-70 factor (ECF subfamily)